jgi:hypothetical protein
MPEVEGDELISLSPSGPQLHGEDYGRTFPASVR